VRGGGLLKMLPIGRWRAPMRRAALSAAVALAASLAGGEAARAACDPAAGSNVTATCTGATNDQGGGAPGTSAGSDGYGTGAETNLDVTVVPGASVTGTNRGIFFNTGSVINSGTITGGRGISADTANVSNSGTISGGDTGISATTIADVINSGTISGGDRGIFATTANVTNSGSISGARGIFATTANVTNSGTISGTRGIDATTANVTNSGTISGSLEGINAVTASVINSGTITGGPRGIVTTGIASVINSGTVTATTGIGIQSLTTANVTNSGTISGAVFGISADTANVSNSGTISGGDGIAAGIANVGNSGTISGTDFGIRAVTTASVTNSGTISGGIAALQFAGNPDTLTLLAGSRIIGAINLAGGGDTVNFRGGNHNLTFDTLAGARVTGTTPFAVSGNRAVAVDPTPFAMTDRNLMDVSRTVAAVIPEIDTAASPGGAPLAFAAAGRSAADVVGDAFAAAMPGLAYAGETAVNPTAVYAGGTAVWARGFVGKRVQQGDGTLLRTENTFYGGMLGADWQAGPNLRVGVFAGGGEAKSSLDLNYGDTKSTLVFGGAYARYRLASAFLHLTVQGGHSGNDTRRQINNNLVPGGIETATASFSGWYATPEAHLGFHHALGIWGGASYTLTPSLRLRYLYASFDGYTESGSTANLTVGTRSVQDFEERGELKFTRTQAFGATAAIATSIYGGVLAVQRVGDTTVDAALLGQAIPFATPGEDNVWGGYGGVGLAWHAERITVFGAAEYTALSDDSSIVSGRAGLRVAF
jgi:outer membrane autotransporter protein